MDGLNISYLTLMTCLNDVWSRRINPHNNDTQLTAHAPQLISYARATNDNSTKGAGYA